MPVFDFNNTPDDKKTAECTYTIFYSGEGEATPEKPMMVLDNQMKKWEHHSLGMFTNPVKRTAFEFQRSAKIISMSACQERIQKKVMQFTRFVRLLSAVEQSFRRKMDFYSL